MNKKEQILKARKEGKSYREIETELGISRATISYHCKSMGINEPINGINYGKINNEEEINKYYLTHTIIETAVYFGISRTSVIKHVNAKTTKLCEDERKRRNYEHVKKRIQKLKELGIEYLGGKCLLCGYDKCMASLEFHHRDPNEKEFTVSHNQSRSWDKLKKEIDKCDLLCSNCHRELHYNLYNKSL
jgi:biotin operon repressor